MLQALKPSTFDEYVINIIELTHRHSPQEYNHPLNLIRLILLLLISKANIENFLPNSTAKGKPHNLSQLPQFFI